MVAGAGIERQRLDRLRSTMADRGADAVLTADPINLLYATGVRNMTIFSMMGPSRFALVTADHVTLWEYAGCEHLVTSPVVDEVIEAPGITPVSGPSHVSGIATLVAQVAERVGRDTHRIAVERLDVDVTDALRAAGYTIEPATGIFVDARRRKTPGEIDRMWTSMQVTIAAVESMRRTLEPGRTEVEVWADFQRALLAADGEYVSTRLAQSGPRTFPYFQEASTRRIESGELFCLDTDAIGPASYAADFSRTFVCGDVPPTSTQRTLHGLASDQLEHNAALLAPGRSYRSFAADSWVVPDRYRAHGYRCLAHGLGLCGEFPYVPLHESDGARTLDGAFEPGMVVCVESYVGSPSDAQGVKLEDQFVITEDGPILMSATDRSL